MNSRTNFLLISLICLFGNVLIAQNFEWKDIKIKKINNQYYLNALAGGLTAPQFNEIDMDLDGIEDLMVFDRDGGAIIPFLYKDGTYVYDHSYKEIFPKFIHWVRCRDFNADGIMDLFCYNIESPLSGIELYVGSVEGGKLKFTKYVTNLEDYEILYYTYQNFSYNMQVISSDIPEIIDVDSDGDLDILTFNPDSGYVLYYKNTNVENGTSLNSPEFVLQDACWGKFYESGFNEEIFLSGNSSKCFMPLVGEGGEDSKGGLHAGSTVSCYDYDQDGDYEMFIGDLTSKHLVFLENGGTPTNAWMVDVDQTFPSYGDIAEIPIFLSSSIVDVDRDGFKDILVSPNNGGGVENVKNVWYYKNNGETGPQTWTFQDDDEFTEMMFDAGSYSSPMFCDYNQDGLLDVLVGTFGFFEEGSFPDARLVLLENVGTAQVPDFKMVNDDYLGFSAYTEDYFTFAPCFGDLDGDGDDDMMVGTNTGRLIYCENTAGPGNTYQFAAPVFEYLGIDVGDNIKPQLIDLNRDGLLDIVIGEKNQNKDPFTGKIGNINYFQNIGTETSPMFGTDETISPNENSLGEVLVKDPLGSTGSAAPFFYDTGEEFILWVGSDKGKIYHYKNIDNNLYGEFTLETDNAAQINEGVRTAISVADITDDGILDMVVGNSRGGIAFYGSNINIDGTVPLANVEKTNLYSLYPNPTTHQLILNTDENASEFEVYNILGQRVLTGNTNIRTTVDVSQLTDGLYKLKVNRKDGNWEILTFVKN